MERTKLEITNQDENEIVVTLIHPDTGKVVRTETCQPDETLVMERD